MGVEERFARCPRAEALTQSQGAGGQSIPLNTQRSSRSARAAAQRAARSARSSASARGARAHYASVATNTPAPAPTLSASVMSYSKAPSVRGASTPSHFKSVL